MDVRGPGLVTFHKGEPCKLYEVVTSTKNLKGCTSVRYLFPAWGDAEIYVYYLYQVAGVDFIHRTLASKKIPKWEKQEYRDFLATVDLSVLEEMIKGLNPDVEKIFTPYIRRPQDGDTDDTDDDCEEYGC